MDVFSYELQPLHTPFDNVSFNSQTISLFPSIPFPAFSFLSLNVNKANYISHAILNSFAETTDVILFQEPWKGKIGSQRSDSCPDGLDVYGMVHQRHWQ